MIALDWATLWLQQLVPHLRKQLTSLSLLHYYVDHLYGALNHRTGIAPGFFAGGWGGKQLAQLEEFITQNLHDFQEKRDSPPWPPAPIRPVWKTVWQDRVSMIQEGVFKSPVGEGLLPRESETARVQLLLPRTANTSGLACVLHLAGTGDHGFKRRLSLGKPLLQYGIATMVLESPFYGDRRPVLQKGSRLAHVSDLLALGRATIEESRSLLYWLEAELGITHQGVCGLSMGGVHAAMVGALQPYPTAITPLLAPHSAAPAFCEGVLSYGTAWEALTRDEVVAEAMAEAVAEGGTPEAVLARTKEKMQRVLSLTDVTKFPVPKKPEAVVLVAANQDAYIPRHSVENLIRAWPGMEVRWVTGGHVSSFLLHGKTFQRAIRDSIERL